jgi:hypothetical protein
VPPQLDDVMGRVDEKVDEVKKRNGGYLKGNGS